MRWLLVALAISCASCWGGMRPIVASADLDDLEDVAAAEMRCEDVEVRRLTLLTRLVEGCGRQRVYAFDALREQWIVESVERR